MKKLGYLLIVIILMIAGCRIQTREFSIPEKQFVLIKNNAKIFVCHKKTKICLPAGEGRGVASGFLIAHNVKNNKSYFLTAGHVCENKIDLKNDDFESKVEKEFHLLDYDNEDNIANVIAIDLKHDICLLETKKVNHPPAVLAKKALPNHSKVINIAAPAGVWSKDVMLHFRGEYQGIHKDLKRDEQAIYIITAQPGSSGSPVYDPASGRVVGIITHVLGPSYDISFGPTTAQINDFVNKNLPK